MSKGKFFKNTLRGQEKTIQPYTPQYVLRGVEPEIINSGIVPEIIPIKNNNDTKHVLVSSSQNNPRRMSASNVNSNVPFAEMQSAPSPIGRGPLPNIGNNIENTWSSADGQVYDDISDEPVMIRKSQKMIDNNEYYDGVEEERSQYSAEEVEFEVEEDKNIFMKDYEYVLLVDGDLISAGSLEEIQEEVKSLIFGQHAMCQERDITQDNITVLKKVQIKVGVFLE